MSLDEFVESKSIDLTAATVRFSQLRGQRTSRAVMVRWARLGYRPRGYEGEPIKLPTVLVGCSLRLMPQWLEWFYEQRLAMGQRGRRLDDGSATARWHKRATAKLQKRGMEC